MAEPRLPDPALVVVATFSRHGDALAWAGERLEKLFGPVGLISSTYEFVHTSYYEATMGPHLSKRFLTFQNLVAADCLPTLKLQTNRLEQELAGSGRFGEPRPLDVDPGLLSLGKFLLA